MEIFRYSSRAWKIFHKMKHLKHRNPPPPRSHCTNPQVCMCEAVFHSKKIIVPSSQDDNLPVPSYKYRYPGTSPVTKYRPGYPTHSESNEDPSQVSSLPVILLSHAQDSKCKVVADQPIRVPEDCGLGELVLDLTVAQCAVGRDLCPMTRM